MIEAHRVPRLCLPALTTGSAQCSGLKNTREMTIQGAHRCSLLLLQDLSVYLTSLFTPLHYLPPAALGQRHKNREMTNVPVSRWLNTIFTKCPQFSQNAHNLMFFVFTKFSSSLQSAFKFDFSSSQISGWILSQCALTLSNFNNINLVVFALSSFSKPIIAILAIVPVDKVVSRDSDKAWQLVWKRWV